MAKRRFPVLESDRVILRLLERTDLPLTLSWRNQDQIRQWFLNAGEISEETHYAWFERYQGLDNDFVFLILARELDNLPVGQISLYHIDWDTRTAEFGRLMIGEAKVRGKGIAKEATSLLINHSLGVMKLKEVRLEVKENNQAATAIYRAVGFRETSRSNGLVSMTIQVNN